MGGCLMIQTVMGTVNLEVRKLVKCPNLILDSKFRKIRSPKNGNWVQGENYRVDCTNRPCQKSKGIGYTHETNEFYQPPGLGNWALSQVSLGDWSNIAISDAKPAGDGLDLQQNLRGGWTFSSKRLGSNVTTESLGKMQNVFIKLPGRIQFESSVNGDETGQLYRWVVSTDEETFPEGVLLFANTLKEDNVMPYECKFCQKRYKQKGVCRDHNRDWEFPLELLRGAPLVRTDG